MEDNWPHAARHRDLGNGGLLCVPKLSGFWFLACSSRNNEHLLNHLGSHQAGQHDTQVIIVGTSDTGSTRGGWTLFGLPSYGFGVIGDLSDLLIEVRMTWFYPTSRTFVHLRRTSFRGSWISDRMQKSSSVTGHLITCGRDGRKLPHKTRLAFLAIQETRLEFHVHVVPCVLDRPTRRKRNILQVVPLLEDEKNNVNISSHNLMRYRTTISFSSNLKNQDGANRSARLSLLMNHAPGTTLSLQQLPRTHIRHDSLRIVGRGGGDGAVKSDILWGTQSRKIYRGDGGLGTGAWYNTQLQCTRPRQLRRVKLTYVLSSVFMSPF